MGRLSKAEVERELCRIVSLAYHSIGDYSEPSDGFCDLCPNSHSTGSFRHAGITLNYVRLAVVAKLNADGYKIAEGYDQETGKILDTSREGDEKLVDTRKKLIDLVNTFGVALGAVKGGVGLNPSE